MAFSKLDIKSYNLDELTELIVDLGLKKYRAGQVFEWIYKNHALSFEEMTNISKSERGLLATRFHLSRPKRIQTETSEDGTQKLLFELEDGHTIESVLIPDDDLSAQAGRLTLCISSQVGCAQACRFCLTGKGGFTRNLAAHEIVDQVLGAEGYLAGAGRNDEGRGTKDNGGGTREEGRETKDEGRRTRGEGRETRDEGRGGAMHASPLQKHITNIVLMGMGEPLANFDEVVKALGIITSNKGLGFSPRRVTLSTAGLVPEIERLGKSGIRVNLAVSLNATTDAVRDLIMPVNRRYPIKELLTACRRHPLEPRKRITFEYVLLKGVNDSEEDALRAAKMLKGIRGKVNLIPFNPFPGSEYDGPDEKTIRRFQRILLDHRYIAPVRESRGRDISAACGQLRERGSHTIETRDEG